MRACITRLNIIWNNRDLSLRINGTTLLGSDIYFFLLNPLENNNTREMIKISWNYSLKGII